jgi:hypothetical protein
VILQNLKPNRKPNVARLVRPDGFVVSGRGRRARRSPFRIALLQSQQIQAFSGQDVVLEIRYRGPGRPRYTPVIVPGIPG